jgi:hypothetical protein
MWTRPTIFTFVERHPEERLCLVAVSGRHGTFEQQGTIRCKELQARAGRRIHVREYGTEAGYARRYCGVPGHVEDDIQLVGIARDEQARRAERREQSGITRIDIAEVDRAGCRARLEPGAVGNDGCAAGVEARQHGAVDGRRSRGTAAIPIDFSTATHLRSSDQTVVRAQVIF